MTILNVDGLVKTYSRRRVVDGVCLDVSEGEIVGLLGPNGAGKTTTFRMICGMVQPDQGSVYLSGEEVTRWPMYLRAREGGMGYLPQQSSVFSKLSARDNLVGMMQMLGFSRKQQKERCETLLDQFKIGHVQKTKAGRLSGGERRRLEIARCLVSEPRIIMLDEPFAGIDPVTVQNIQSIIRDLAEQGIAILITDHAAREILQITDRTYVVSEGRILVDGTAEEIVRHEEVRRKYLGDIEFTKKVRIDEQVAGSRKELSPDAILPEGNRPAVENAIQFRKKNRPAMKSKADKAEGQSTSEADVTFAESSSESQRKATDLD